jgi:hypothetical protein
MIHPAWRFCLFLSVSLLGGCSVGPTNGFKNEDVLAVRVGMSEADVLRIVGPPTRKVHSTGDNLDSWTWVDAGMTRTRVATIVFSKGVVVQVPNRESRSAADLSKQNAEKAVELNKIRSVERQKQDAAEADALAAAVEKRRSDYIESHPGLSESTRNAVKKGLVQVGLLEVVPNRRTTSFTSYRLRLLIAASTPHLRSLGSISQVVHGHATVN